MTTIQQSRAMPQPADGVWAVIGNYSHIHYFHPFVENTRMLTPQQRGPGAKRRCEFYDQRGVEEEITEWKEGESFTVALTKTAMPLEQATATMRVSPMGADTSVVTIEMSYSPKYGPLGWLLDRLVMRRALGRMFARVLQGLEDHIVSGRLIGRHGAAGDYLPKSGSAVPGASRG